MVPRDPEGIGRGQAEYVRFVSVCEDVKRLGKGRIEQRFVAYAIGTAMLGKLFTVHRENGLFRDPERLIHYSASFRRTSMLPHHAPCSFHFAGKLLIERSELDSVRGIDEIQA